ncbi:response regulator transcription factor [Thermoanaerobacterium butyriciformans]|uniref:Stage 0 sporulation protein A homolog n=1 Tax=Thermoanaerobacterium butyriciformans TaxID=1702242 RepID=A0ABS4NH08_9THEO|nr:response regulator transcription factor [Thermoanaerobacterium butyriciformans]MBP2072424.1 DNA-binding response OmpR family regulator [Thermoanaerobacterium butyriciformans]
MSKILIIDDEKEIVDLLKDSLERKGNIVLTAYNGKEGIEKAKEMPDLIVLDIMMPDIDGYEVCRKIRDTVICPIVFLSAKQSEMDRIKGFALGGDDYVVKPFSLKELLARIDAHLRREKRAILLNEEGKRTLLNFKNITIDLKSREVMVKGNPIGLTKKEFDVLELLSLHPGQVFSKEQIYEKVWGFDADGDTTTVTEHIKNIRAKIENLDPDTEYIKTVWGIGYKWEKFL